MAPTLAAMPDSRPPAGIVALGAVFVLSAALLLLAPVRWLATPEQRVPEPPADAPGYQHAIHAVVAVEAERAEAEGDPGYRGDRGEWSAAFAAWVLESAGLPPGEPGRLPRDPAQLRAAFAAHGAFLDADDYAPHPGDVIFHRGPLGEHCAVLVRVSGDTVTAAGGDELGRIRVTSYDLRSRRGVLGFGRTGMLEEARLATAGGAPPAGR